MRITITEEDVKNYEYFKKGEVPCFFLVEVEEGFARFEIRTKENLATMIRYLARKKYEVQWTAAVIKEDASLKEYRGFPGGKYVAHRTDLKRFLPDQDGWDDLTGEDAWNEPRDDEPGDGEE